MKQKLSEIANITMGQSPLSGCYNSDGIGTPFLQGCTTFGRVYPSYDTWTTQFNKSANKDDVLFTVRAPVGDVNLCQRFTAIGRGLASIHATKVSPKYLFYLLEGNKSAFTSESSGTIYQSINKDKLCNVILNVHDSGTQQHIVDTIGSVDDLIEKKLQTIAKIDELAQKTFDAKFASDREKTYALRDICDFTAGYSYKGDELKESSMGMISIKCIERENGFRREGIKSLCPEKQIPSEKRCNINDILVCHTDLTKNQDIIGRPILVPTKGTYSSLTYSMDLIKVSTKSNEFSNALVFRILNSKSFKKHALGFCSGTTVVHLSKKALQTYHFNGPSQGFEKLSDNLQNYQNQIIILTSEIDILENQKSLLLSKYFS